MSQKYSILFSLFSGWFFVFLSGCSAPCNYPTQGMVHVRIINAIPDEPIITIRLNGKILVQNFPYDTTNTGYISNYADGSIIQVGSSLPVVISSDAAGKNIILTTTVSIDFHRQTIIALGKAHPIPGSDQPVKVLGIVDDAQTPDPNTTLMRFIHAIPDLPALDIYWNKPDGSPNATIFFGVDNPYLDLQSADSLKITEAGNPHNVIFFSRYPAGALPKDLVVTTIVRGESKPYGSDKIVSTWLLSDAPTGNILIPYQTFGLRFINASRALMLSLLIKGSQDAKIRGDYANQGFVENIGPDSIGSEYLPMLPSFNSNSQYIISTRDFDPIDTVLLFYSRFPFIQNGLYSIIAVENTVLNQTPRSIDTLILVDSMTVQPGMGRVRLIHLNPDHPKISFALGGRQVTNMQKKQVEFFDVPIGTQTITLDDGTTKKTVSFNVPSGRPITLYLMPDTSVSNPYPIKTSIDP